MKTTRIFFGVLFLAINLFWPDSLRASDLLYLEEGDGGYTDTYDRDEFLASRSDLDQAPPGQLGYQDFESYGHWILTAEYGNVWVPDVDETWVPFRYGRWIWNPYYGWVWVSEEVWGWRPFHYGRWIHLDFEGWAWIPGPPVQVWSPGVVRWVWSFNQIGWVPLAPGEIYYPFYSYRRVYPPAINAVRVPRSVTYLRRDRLIRSVDPHPSIPVPRGQVFVPPERPRPSIREERFPRLNRFTPEPPRKTFVPPREIPLRQNPPQRFIERPRVQRPPAVNPKVPFRQKETEKPEPEHRRMIR